MQTRLAEAKQTIIAIRSGDVDALVIDREVSEGRRIGRRYCGNFTRFLRFHEVVMKIIESRIGGIEVTS